MSFSTDLFPRMQPHVVRMSMFTMKKTTLLLKAQQSILNTINSSWRTAPHKYVRSSHFPCENHLGNTSIMFYSNPA